MDVPNHIVMFSTQESHQALHLMVLLVVWVVMGGLKETESMISNSYYFSELKEEVSQVFLEGIAKLLCMVNVTKP